MADLQKKSANIINAAAPSETARTTVTSLSNGGIEVSISNATWTQCRYTNIPVVANVEYTLSIYIDEYSGTGTFMIPLRQINGNGTVISTDTITQTGTITHTFTAEGSTVWLGVYLNNSGTAATASAKIRIMLNEGATALPYEPYYPHSLRKLATATEAVENPLYSDGTAITAYTIKGNTVQNGTPTPSNPVMPNGVGERTENLFDGSYSDGYIGGDTGTRYSTSSAAKTAIVKCEPNTIYTIKKITSSNRFTIATSASYPQDSDIVNVMFSSPTETTATITTPADTSYLLIYVSTSSEQATPDMMLNTGSTALPYEPYGYKIPISSGGVTTNIYLGSTQTVRRVKKLVLTGEEDWSVAGLNVGQIPYFRITYFTSAQPSKVVCTHYVSPNETISVSNQVEGVKVQASSEAQIVLIIRPPEFAVWSVDDFKSFLAAQYAAGTPVTVWYVLATPETAAVNEPLMKIGTYADTLSNAASIPTADGANSITVDTTVQPSEFTATWTGWHDSSVKEYDGSDWQ